MKFIVMPVRRLSMSIYKIIGKIKLSSHTKLNHLNMNGVVRWAIYNRNPFVSFAHTFTLIKFTQSSI